MGLGWISSGSLVFGNEMLTIWPGLCQRLTVSRAGGIGNGEERRVLSFDAKWEIRSGFWFLAPRVCWGMRYFASFLRAEITQ